MTVITACLAWLAAAADKPPQGFVVHEETRELPDVVFRDADGEKVRLSDFRGRTVLLNIWATWCSPCRREMPTLDRLQATLGGPDFEVVALSIDRAGVGVVTEFYEEIGIQHLAKYIDASGKAARGLNAAGVPTTLLIDREGREIGRYVGPAEWATPEMVAFFRRYLSRDSGALWPGPTLRLAHGPAGRRIAGTAPVRFFRPPRLDLPVTGTPISSTTSEGT